MSAHQTPSLTILPHLHTNMASTLRSRHDNRPDLYLACTFPALLIFNVHTIPIVLATEERLANFQYDVRRIVAVPVDCGFLNLRVFIPGGLDVYLCEENICAVLRHLREARDGCIIVEELGRPVYPGFEGESLEDLILEDRVGRSVFGA